MTDALLSKLLNNNRKYCIPEPNNNGDKNSQNHFSGLDSITNNEGKITFSLDASNIDSKQSLEENIKEEITFYLVYDTKK